MADLLHYCEKFSKPDEAALQELLQGLRTKKLKKGEYLLKHHEVCRHLYFVNEGLLKTFFYKNDKEFIMRFFSENVLFSEFDSCLKQQPSTFMIKALEPTTVTLISYKKIEGLCKKHHSMETFFRKLISVAALKMMARISDMLEESSTRRYEKFVKENGPLVQRINLGDLARYLGITQQSLSRIRAGK